jgi:cell cycle arrest protein BUB3
MSKSKLVAAMGGRAVWIWDVRQLGEVLEKREEEREEVKSWQERESSLKFMTRAVKCMPNDLGSCPSLLFITLTIY